MSSDLVGRWAVVTGASRNIGLATATLLARQGANVVMCSRGPGDLELAADAVRQVAADAEVVPVVADVGTPDGRESLVERARAAAGPRGVDILVNNAYSHGSTSELDVLDVPDEVWRQTFDVNVHAPYALAAAFGRDMRRSGRGTVINVIAGPGLTPARGWIAYGATTAALWAITRYLAAECGPQIRVNAVCPGTIHAPDEYRAYAREVLLPSVPLGRIGEPSEVAEVIAFLASDAASYTSGAVVTVNGGRIW